MPNESESQIVFSKLDKSKKVCGQICHQLFICADGDSPCVINAVQIYFSFQPGKILVNRFSCALPMPVIVNN